MRDYKNDIDKYCKGELSPAEMHALEKKALSDPFLAEALEGATSVSPEEFSHDLDSLRERLPLKQRRVIPIWVWSARIAAGLTVIAIATFLLTNRSDKDDLLSYSEKPVAEAPAPEEEAQSQTDADEERLRQEEARRSAEERASSRRRKPEVSRDLALEEEEVAEEVLIPEIILPAPSVAAGPAKREKPRKLVQGFVVDADDGKGLPGVNVTIRGTDIGTITDEEGNYQIAMDSLNSGLLFSYIGFESREIVPGSTNEVNVALSPDISELSEVVVVGYGVSREPGIAEPAIVEMATPAGGKKAFKQYLVQSLQYPEQALNNKIEGKVTVQFTIETNGKLSDFLVLKGIGYGCDEEVIRLIKSGPKWSPTKRNHEAVRDKVKVRLRFSLPKK